MTPSMNRFPIESASFVSVGYSAEQSLLEVEFRDGAVYRFFDVPASCFQQLLTSDSRGDTSTEVSVTASVISELAR